MSNEEDVEEPAVALVTTSSGQHYDIKNIPGFLRKRLIENGELSIGSFVQADNMPGHKLQKMRESFSINNKFDSSTTPTLDINTLAEGDLVSYKKFTTEVKKVNVEKGLVLIDIKGVKKGWVGVDKLKAVVIPRVEEEE